MTDKQYIEQDGIKYEVVKIVEKKEADQVVIDDLGDVTEYECWYDRKYCLEAVKKNGNALMYVKEQTKDICLAAVKENGNALMYVNKKTFEKKGKEADVKMMDYNKKNFHNAMKMETEYLTNKAFNKLMEEYKDTRYKLDSNIIGQVTIHDGYDIALYAFKLDKNWIVRRSL